MPNKKFIIDFENVDDIPDEELLILHKKYWAFIADTGLAAKPDIVLKNGKRARIINCCFLCEYAQRKQLKEYTRQHICYYCPCVKYKGIAFGCTNVLDSPYIKWLKVIDQANARKYAYEIAELKLVET